MRALREMQLSLGDTAGWPDDTAWSNHTVSCDIVGNFPLLKLKGIEFSFQAYVLNGLTILHGATMQEVAISSEEETWGLAGLTPLPKASARIEKRSKREIPDSFQRRLSRPAED